MSYAPPGQEINPVLEGNGLGEVSPSLRVDPTQAYGSRRFSLFFRNWRAIEPRRTKPLKMRALKQNLANSLPYVETEPVARHTREWRAE